MRLVRVRIPRVLLLVIGAACVTSAQAATYQQRVNATRAPIAAKGTNGIVVQVEAPSPSSSGQSSAMHYSPDRTSVQFKRVDIRIDTAAKTSSHSDTVAQLLYGSKRSIARGITTAYVFQSSQWLGRLSRWNLDPAHVSRLFPGAVINHSYVANHGLSGKLLLRADYSALSNNVLHVAGVRRRGAGDALMAGGYNSLVVGGAMENITTPYPAIDEFYSAGRTRPHLVGPYPHASAAVPVIAAAAVRLNALAASKELVFPTTARYSSEQLPVELIKAILMVSASGDFEYTHKKELLVNSFGASGTTANGLDKRYGMGMLNVGAAEHILRQPQRNHLENPAEPQPASSGTGYVYHPGMAGTDSDVMHVAVVPKKTGRFTASLVWLATVERDQGTLRGRLFDFDLCLTRTGKAANSVAQSSLVAESVADFDTTENIKAVLEKGYEYTLTVTRKDGAKKPWPFALAWNLSK